jgi:tetratricopeptide (TPR) repeat protein
LYRGLKLTIDELQKLEENIGNLISTNGFLSTSRNRQVALFFATNVLFEIETNIGLQGKMWYDIAQRSKVPDEEEVIFDIGATFRIESISYDSERNLRVVHLKTTENIDTASYLQGSNAEIFLGQLYYYMGNYEKSKRYLNVLLEHLKNDYHRNNISALTDFVKLKRTYDIGIQNRIDKHLLDDVSTLSVIAGAYEKNGNYEKAIETMKRALCLLAEH